MAETIGSVPCVDCGTDAKVCADKRKFLYLNCPCCGIFKYQTHTGQKRIRDRFARLGSPLGEPAPFVACDDPAQVPGESKTPAPVPEKPPVPKPKPRGLLAGLFRSARHD